MKPSKVNAISRGVVCFWALWFSIVFASNVCDALMHLGLLPETWPFASGNFVAITKVTARYTIPTAVLGGLFLGVILWELVGAVLFWRAVVSMALTCLDRGILYGAFGCGLALMAAFVITDEICIVYDLEAAHLRLLVAMLISLLFVEFVPDARCDAATGDK